MNIKKYISLLILLIGIFILPNFSFASVAFTVSPSTVTSTMENAMNITLPSPTHSSGYFFFLFDSNNIGLTPIDNGRQTGNSFTYSQTGLATGLSTGSYNIAAIDFQYDTGEENGFCHTGSNLGTCQSALQDGGVSDMGIYNIFITAAPVISTSTPSSTPSNCNLNGGLMSSSSLASTTDCINKTGMDYFGVLLQKYWPYAVGMGVLAGTWHYGAAIIAMFL